MVVLKPSPQIPGSKPNHQKPCDLGEFPPVKVDCVLTTTPPAAAKASESAAEAWEEGGQIPCLCRVVDYAESLRSGEAGLPTVRGKAQASRRLVPPA